MCHVFKYAKNLCQGRKNIGSSQIVVGKIYIRKDIDRVIFSKIRNEPKVGSFLVCEPIEDSGQVLAALLLLLPQTATLGALIYFPIILNICILSLAVGFEGSLISSVLMVYANLYLICWDYDKLKYILPFKSQKTAYQEEDTASLNEKFPAKFFIGVLTSIILTIFVLLNAYTKVPRNTLQDCINDCQESGNRQECFDFCECIHKQGKSFDKCTEELKRVRKNAK